MILSHAKSQFILLAPDESSWVVCECPKLAAVYVRIGHGSATISVRRNRLAELQSTRDATNKSLSHPETESSSGAGKRYARPRVSSCVVLAIIIHLPIYIYLCCRPLLGRNNCTLTHTTIPRSRYSVILAITKEKRLAKERTFALFNLAITPPPPPRPHIILLASSHNNGLIASHHHESRCLGQQCRWYSQAHQGHKFLASAQEREELAPRRHSRPCLLCHPQSG